MEIFSPFRLFFTLFWIAWGIFTLSRLVQNKYLLENKYRQWIALCTLFTGPIIEIVFLFIEGRYELNMQKEKEEREKIKAIENQLEIVDSQGQPVFESTSSETGSAFAYVKHLIADAVNRKASDIFINPQDETTYSVRYRQDGTLYEAARLAKRDALGCLSVIKVASSMDISEHRRPQDGAFSAHLESGKLSFRVATVGSYGGEKMALRVLGSVNGVRKLEDIGMSDENLKIMQNAVRYPDGLVLMCGPTGSGKTSTLYALIQAIDYSIKNVISIEDPIESEMSRVSQMEVNNMAGITFSSLLRNALRQNPDIICIGEIRDEETASIAVQSAQTGHLIIATVHSNDNLGTLDRLKMLGLPFRTVAETLRVVISQRLVRQLCPHCKKKINLSPEFEEYFKSAGLPTDNIYTAAGCPECNMTGYKGRHAVFDILVLTDSLKKILESESVTIAAIREGIEAEHGVSMLSLDGYRLVSQGLTSLEEVARITVQKG